MPPAIGPDGQTIKRRLSIASPIWLYLVLLDIVLIPRFLSTQTSFNFKDEMDVMRLMAIVVVTWAMICWRDTLPSVRNLGGASFWFIAFLTGIATAVFTSLYGSMFAALVHVPPPNSAQFLIENGCGWISILALTALYPAVFEELAVRGIILKQLQRVLTSKEAIAVSGMMFMILHLNIVNAPALLTAGILLGYFRVKSGSIWPGVLLHFTNNAVILALEHWHF